MARYGTLLSGIAIVLAQNAGAQLQCVDIPALATPYDSNNGLDGIMFDLTALQTVTINCFEVNMAAGTSDAVIRHKDGTHVGFEANAAAWTPIDSVEGLVTTGPDLPTYLPIDVNVTIAAGTTHAFYISNRTAAAPNTKYTDGTSLGLVFASDANLQVREGTGINYPFGFHLSPRRFNGTIHYTAGTSGTQEIGASPSLTLAPNPAVDRLRIGGQPAAVITVTDAMGRVVLSIPWASSVDVLQLAPGSYVLTIQDRNGTMIASRVFLKE